MAIDPQTALFLFQAGNTLYRHLKPGRQKQLVEGVLDSQTQFRDRLARQAFGNFTAAERQQIAAATEPQVNQIASGVARRGLGGSGAGAQVIAQAQQAPFAIAQQNAMQALPNANQALLQTASVLPSDDPITPLLGSLQGKLGLLNADREANLTFTEIFNMLFGIESEATATSTSTSTATVPSLPNFGSDRVVQGWDAWRNR